MHLELHDSVLAGLKWDGPTAVLQFRPAYLHQSAGRPGIDPGEVYIQDYDLVVSDARLGDDAPALPFIVWDGALAFGAQELVNLLPGDLHGTQPVFLRLVPAAGHRELTVSGTALALHPAGSPQFIESFPG